MIVNLRPHTSHCFGRGFRRVAFALFSGYLLLVLGCFSPQTRMQAEEEERERILDIDTIYDVAEVGNVTPIQVQGVGLVTGLDGTGGGTPAGNLRTMLENELRKQKIANPKQLIDSEDTSLVVVTGFIPAGSRRGEAFDVHITLPPGSKVSSLRGGVLQECNLRNFESSKKISPKSLGADRWLPGHILAKARGPLIVGLDQAAHQEANLRAGIIWEGAISNIDRPYYFMLKEKRKLARVANAVAQRINAMFQEDPKKRLELLKMKGLFVLDEVTGQLNNKFSQSVLGEREMAKAINHQIVEVNVPLEYRLNTQRYILVALQIPLLESKDKKLPYREKLKEMLMDPAQTVRAAVRLEALGKESIPALKAGLQSPHTLVRFACAESLAYLGDSSGVPELGTLADQHYQLRAYCLTALSSLEDTASRMRLMELLASTNAETRYGAFRALQLLNVKSAATSGEFLNNSFWLHRVAPNSPSLVHYTLHRKAEVALFGQDSFLVPPFAILANKKFTITAAPEDKLCTISRYDLKAETLTRKQCSLRLEDVLRTLADMGAEYPEVVELLRQTEDQKCLNSSIVINAVPQPMAVEELAKKGKEPGFLSMPSEGNISPVINVQGAANPAATVSKK